MKTPDRRDALGVLQNAKPCHSEPVTYVTGSEIRICLQRKTDCHDQFANWSRNDSAFCYTPLLYETFWRGQTLYERVLKRTGCSFSFVHSC